jgi:hypothetical protein
VTTGEFRDHFVNVMTQRLTPPNEADTSSSSITNSAGKKKKNKGKSPKGDDKNSFAQNEANTQLLQTINALDWDDLFLSKGFPKYSIDFKNSLSLTAKVLARHWYEISKETNNKKFTPSKSDIMGWSSQQICLFLDTLLDYSQQSGSFTVAFLEQLNSFYQFNSSKNAEICLRWQSLGLKANAPWIVPQVVEFITSQGRMKFVRPLYRLFRQSQVGGQLANDTFQKHKMMYHPIARKMLEADLNRINDSEKKQPQAIPEEEQDDEPVASKQRTDSAGENESMPDLEAVSVDSSLPVTQPVSVRAAATEEPPKMPVIIQEKKEETPVPRTQAPVAVPPLAPMPTTASTSSNGKSEDPLWQEVKKVPKDEGKPTYSSVTAGAAPAPKVEEQKKSFPQEDKKKKVHEEPVKENRVSTFKNPYFFVGLIATVGILSLLWNRSKKH